MTNYQSIKLIALDMDGTLLNSKLEVSERTRKAIAEALAKDVHVVLSTGRGFRSCYPYAEELKLTSYLITANGGEIWTVEKELLDQHLMDTAVMVELWNLGKEADIKMWMTSTEGVLHSEPDNFYDYQWLKFGCYSKDQEKLAEMKHNLSKYDALEITNSLPTNLEANPIGVNKAKGLEFLCKRIGITMDQVMACGDSLNDMKMIQGAGLGVAMGNAQDPIKEAATFITDTNDQDGVAKAIEKFVLQR